MREPARDPLLKEVDAWWTVIAVDPLAVPLTRALAKVPAITPVHVTLAAHLIGVVTAAMFLGGWLVPAAILFEVRFVLDCADGKLARLTGRGSERGAFLDFVGDGIVVGLNLVALCTRYVWDDRLAVWAAASLPALLIAYIWLAQARATAATKQSRDIPLTADRLPGGYQAWMRRHRLRSLPSRIEAEHGLLFVAPLVAGLLDAPGVLVVALYTGVAYFVYEVAHLSLASWKLAVGADRPSA